MSDPCNLKLNLFTGYLPLINVTEKHVILNLEIAFFCKIVILLFMLQKLCYFGLISLFSVSQKRQRLIEQISALLPLQAVHLFNFSSVHVFCKKVGLLVLPYKKKVSEVCFYFCERFFFPKLFVISKFVIRSRKCQENNFFLFLTT